MCLNLKEKEVVTAVQTLPAAGVNQSVMPLQAVAASAMSEASSRFRGEGSRNKEARAEGFLIEITVGGHFYAAPAEDAAPYVAVGDTVKGQTVAIVEAMKLMNDIESDLTAQWLKFLWKTVRW